MLCKGLDLFGKEVNAIASVSMAKAMPPRRKSCRETMRTIHKWVSGDVEMIR